MSDAIYNVLFPCTGDTARTIPAEGILSNPPIKSVDRLSLGAKLRDIGRMDGSTVKAKEQ